MVLLIFIMTSPCLSAPLAVALICGHCLETNGIRADFQSVIGSFRLMSALQHSLMVFAWISALRVRSSASSYPFFIARRLLPSQSKSPDFRRLLISPTKAGRCSFPAFPSSYMEDGSDHAEIHERRYETAYTWQRSDLANYGTLLLW